MEDSSRLPGFRCAIGFGLFVSLACSASAQEAADWRIENLPASDGTLYRCIVVRTVPGVRYRIQSSPDMQAWDTPAEIYGLVSFKLGTATSPATPLGVKVMKRRQVKVALWPVRSMLGGEWKAPEYGAVPDPEALEAALETELNATFPPQINAEFDVDVKDPADVDWDGKNGGNADGKLNWNAENLTGEQLWIMDKARDGGADINIYLIGGQTPLDLAAKGLTPERSLNTSWLAGSTKHGTADPGDLAKTVAHEIGHVMMGSGHPDQNSGEAPLKGLPVFEHRKRLMCSGRIPGSGRLLVKAEWDKCEEWLKDNVDDSQ